MIRIFDSGRVEVWTGKGRGPCPIATMTIDSDGDKMLANARIIAKELSKTTYVELTTNRGFDIERFGHEQERIQR